MRRSTGNPHASIWSAEQDLNPGVFLKLRPLTTKLGYTTNTGNRPMCQPDDRSAFSPHHHYFIDETLKKVK